VLNNLKAIAEGKQPIGPITVRWPSRSRARHLRGAVLVDIPRVDRLATKIVTVVLIILMSVSTFTTQRQLMRKNLPDSALDNPFMKQQTVMLYLMPIFFADLGHQLPDRCAALLAHDQRVVDGPAVLRHPPDAGPRLGRRAGVARAPAAKGVLSGQRVQPKGKKRAKKSGPKNTSAQQPKDGGGSSAAIGDSD
jgi:YidC/Oxa1 family membrane protein insertase